eukprot:4856227-Prymnesium_polylepis.1
MCRAAPAEKAAFDHALEDVRGHLPPDCKSTREKIPECYLHLGTGAHRRHEIADACRVLGARHLVD